MSEENKSESGLAFQCGKTSVLLPKDATKEEWEKVKRFVDKWFEVEKRVLK